MSNSPGRVAVLTRAGVGLLLDTGDETSLPRVLHWGAPVGEIDPSMLPAAEDVLGPGTRANAPEVPVAPPLVPTEADGWLGRPGIAGHRGGRWPHPRLRLTQPIDIDDDSSGGVSARMESADADAGLRLTTHLELSRFGVVVLRHRLSNTGTDPWTVDGVRAVLPVPGHADELVDWTGRWGLERVVQRATFNYGVHSRENRRGRTGHDATGLLVAGTRGFGFRHGEVWGVHLGWSGNHVHYAERLPEGWSVLGAGELLAPGEVVLAPGETYEPPPAYFVYSADGLDGMSTALHGWIRSRPQHVRSSRPVVLNTWEAVYFNHDSTKLFELADRAGAIGVERFVLDDGWFRGRRSSRAGLGDWQVDRDVWPDGLNPLVDRVRRHGMQFGLWVEPEMVSPDSDLARRHPEWMLAAPSRTPLEWRHQQVLDLARSEVFSYLLDALTALVAEYEIDYLKWDHNRDLLEAVHDGSAGVRAQTLAVYRLIDELRGRHPGLEIESCASGGGRVDLGILERTDRVWTSDTNDPVDRQEIQRWLSVLVPPELIGSHVGPARAHVTGRHASLQLRCVTALFWHAGIEWDLTECDADELDRLAAWITAYKRLRPLLHSGQVVRADSVDENHLLHGVVAGDKRSAVFAYVVTNSVPAVVRPRLRLPGLRSDLTYRIRLTPELEADFPRQWRQPAWLREASLAVPGSLLTNVGLAAPLLNPGQAVVLELNAS